MVEHESRMGQPDPSHALTRPCFLRALHRSCHALSLSLSSWTFCGALFSPLSQSLALLGSHGHDGILSWTSYGALSSSLPLADQMKIGS